MPWILAPEAPIPPDMSLRHGLYCLYALQQWEAITQPASGPYKPGYFYGAIEGVLHGLAVTSRKTALQHMERRVCTVCTTPIDTAKSVLDHLMPTSKGGPDTLDNTCMLCRSCNSSKGAKDLLQWWEDKDRHPKDLDRLIVCLYARVYWQYALPETLRAPASDAMASFLATRKEHVLPSAQHQIALHGSAYAACALLSWLTSPQKGHAYA